MTDVSYAPSDIQLVFDHTIFCNYQKETIAAHIAYYLAQNGNRWDANIPLRKFMEGMETAQLPVPAMRDPMHNPVFEPHFIPMMRWLAAEGYLVLNSETRSFSLTDKMVAFYGDYRLM